MGNIPSTLLEDLSEGTSFADEIDRLAKRFMKLDTDHWGRSEDEFLRHPGHSQNPLARCMDIFDEDKAETSTSGSL